MTWKNKETERIYQNKYYHKHKEKWIEGTANRRNKIRAALITYKAERGCAQCGEKHPSTLDFHHNGNKEMCVSKMVQMGRSLKNIMIEIDGCNILCSNCHRKLHWAR